MGVGLCELESMGKWCGWWVSVQQVVWAVMGLKL